MTTPRPTEPTDPRRVRSFAIFFKNYMSISTLVVAALPVPVTSLHIIPTFAAQTSLLSVYTSLFCFLLLGFVFYLRHSLARTMFPDFFFRRRADADAATDPPSRLPDIWRRAQIVFVNALPLLFIASSLILVFQYNDVLKSEVNKVLEYNKAVRRVGPGNVRMDHANGNLLFSGTEEPRSYTEDQYPLTFKGILATTDSNNLIYGSRLMLLYVGIFLTAETAFILMAIKEYLQDLVGLSDLELIKISHADNDDATIPVSQPEPALTQPRGEGADI